MKEGRKKGRESRDGERVGGKRGEGWSVCVCVCVCAHVHMRVCMWVDMEWI